MGGKTSYLLWTSKIYDPSPRMNTDLIKIVSIIWTIFCIIFSTSLLAREWRITRILLTKNVLEYKTHLNLSIYFF